MTGPHPLVGADTPAGIRPVRRVSTDAPVELDPRKAVWAGAQAVTEAIASQQPGAFAVRDCGKDWWTAPQSATRYPAEYDGDWAVSCVYRLGDRTFRVRVSLEENTDADG